VKSQISLGAFDMKKNAAILVVRAEQGEDPALSHSSDGKDDVFLTPREAAGYLRVSKSYLDKLRVYGGGPTFLRFGSSTGNRPSTSGQPTAALAQRANIERYHKTN
jgi:hypothetical protein